MGERADMPALTAHWHGIQAESRHKVAQKCAEVAFCRAFAV
jgi:hypothetical protein